MNLLNSLAFIQYMPKKLVLQLHHSVWFLRDTMDILILFR